MKFVRESKREIIYIYIDILLEEESSQDSRRLRAGGDTRNSTVVNPALNLEQSNVHCLPSSVSRRNTNSSPLVLVYARLYARIHKRIHTPTHTRELSRTHTHEYRASPRLSHERVSIARGAITMENLTAFDLKGNNGGRRYLLAQLFRQPRRRRRL